MKANAIRAASYDSLLDTIANVVAVLFVVLLVIQVATSEPPRTGEGANARPSNAEVVAVQQDAHRTGERLSKARAHRDELEPQAKAAQAALPELEREIARHRSRQRRTRDVPREADGMSEHELREQVRGLEAALAEAKERKRSLEQKVTETEDAKPSRSIHLPDPRPAPKNASPVLFFCRYGRVFRPNMKKLDPLLANGIRQSVNAPTGQIRVQSTDIPGIARHFEQNVIGDDSLRWRILNRTDGLIAQLDWRDRHEGETAGEIRSGNSNYRGELRGLSSGGHFLRFMVWSDSFDVYLQARQIASQSGFRAGWVAYAPGEELRSDLSSERDGELTVD